MPRTPRDTRVKGVKFIPELPGNKRPLPEGAAVRIIVDIDKPFRVQLRKQLKSFPADASYETFWLDFGQKALKDWFHAREIFKFFLNGVQERFSSITGVGVAADSLIIPGSHEGHFSLENLNYCFRSLPNTWQKWAAIPFSPVYAGAYLNSGFYHNSRGWTFFEMCDRMELNLQADLPVKNKRLDSLVSSGVLNDLPGSGVSQQFLALLDLFPQIKRVRMPDEHYISCKDIMSHIVDRQKIGYKSTTVKTGAPGKKAVRAWRKHPRLPKVRVAIRDAYESQIINRLELVELLCVLTGRKTAMRTTATPTNFKALADFLKRHEIAFEHNVCQIGIKRDRGKGGWSNLYDPRANGSTGAKEFMIYVGLSDEIVKQAAGLEKMDDESFGEILTYPECCRAAFSRNLPYATGKQGDLVPLVVDQTFSRAPWNHLLNIGSRYFERSLISFYPCAFDCRAAEKYAAETLRLITEYLPEFENELIESLKAPILYTEYSGVYMFYKAKVSDGIINYSPGHLRMTTENRIGADLKSSRQLVIDDTHHVTITEGKRIVRVLKGDNIRALLYD